MFRDGGQLYTTDRAASTKTFPGIGWAPMREEYDCLSDQTMETARMWLQECIKSHKHSQTCQESPMPTRVLDVGITGPDIHLMKTSNVVGKWATLSHCWGSSPDLKPLQTTKATLEERKRSIPLKDLPKTLLEAVIVARQLGVQFLWIDSLCIIQDSTEDWLRETVLMQNVYEKAYFNIAASHAANSNIGLSGLKLPAGDLVHEKTIYVRRIHDLLFFRRRAIKSVAHDGKCYGWQRHLREDILNTRAWVFQERILSCRILHFDEYEIVWECDTEKKCECSSKYRRSYQSRFRTLLYNNAICSNDQSRSELWSSILESYTSLNLTNESDALKAISGIASKAATSLGKTDIGGLWKEDLPGSLLWCTQYDGMRIGMRRAQLFPSWSWAAINAKISYKPGDRRFLHQRLSYNSGRKGDDLRCWIQGREDEETAKFATTQNNSMCVSGWIAEIPPMFRMEMIKFNVEKSIEIYIDCLEYLGIAARSSPNPRFCFDVRDDSEIQQDIHLLFVATYTKYHWFLVIRRHPSYFDDSKVQYFQRIGIFYLGREGGNRHSFNDLKDEFEFKDITLL